MNRMSKRQYIIRAIHELLHTFALVNLVIWISNWLGLVTVNTTYKLSDITGLMIITGIYVMSVALKVWSLGKRNI